MSNPTKLKKFDEREEEEEGDPDLRNLIETYLVKTEELESRENKVMRQVELMQAAVTSLQAWNERRKAAKKDPVPVEVSEIEEETKLIQEETKRIEKEIQERMEENKRLEEEIVRKKSKHNEKEEFFNEVVRKLEKEADLRRKDRKSIETRVASTSDLSDDQKFKFFTEKLRNLQEKEKLLKRESEQEWKDLRRKKRDLLRKVEALEWGSQIGKELIDQIKKKS